MNSTSPRIERGAALLDLHAPGWEDRIDLPILDLRHSSYCVVGQLYGSFYSGIDALDGEAAADPARYGFITWGGETFDALTDKWRSFIEARRDRKAAA